MNDYGTILNRLNTEVSAFKTDLPVDQNNTLNFTSETSFFTKYIYHIAGVCIVLLIILLVTTKPFFIMKEEETVDNSNVKYKTKKMCMKKLLISTISILLVCTILYFVYKYKIASSFSG